MTNRVSRVLAGCLGAMALLGAAPGALAGSDAERMADIRDQGGCPGCDLRLAELRGLTLDGGNFAGANLREVDWASLSMNFVMIFSPGLLERAPQSHIATVKADAAAEDALEIAVTDRFINVSSIRVKEALEQVGELIGQIAIAVRAIAAVALVAGVLVLAGAVAAGHHRRVYDAVVLKVLGATRRSVAQTFLLEYGLLGLVTAAIAAAIGTLAAYLVLTEIMRADFVFLPGAVVTTALLATAITVGFGFAGTWRALGQKAAPLLRNE